MSLSHIGQWSLLGIGLMILSTLIGCRAVEHYLYKDIEMPLFEGKLQIAVQATPKDYDLDGKRLTKYEAPYSIRLKFVTESGNIEKIYVSNITLENQKTGAVIPLISRERQKSSKHPYEEKSIQSVSVGIGYEGETRDWSYEPYVLKAHVCVYRDAENFDEQTIEVLLEPKFKKSRRSDTFDSIMSI